MFTLRGRPLLIVATGLVAGGLTLSACATAEPPLIDSVDELDVERYMGRWYDVASYPQQFQEGCQCTTATYTLNDGGDVRVDNKCRIDSLDGDKTGIEGRAFVPDADRPAELLVEFFWPLPAGDYWVVRLDEPTDDASAPYPLAIVSEPQMDTLWVLSREPELSDERWTEVESWLDEQGFDLERLQRVQQAGCAE
jgi:apolipoprotein D and lipocalin family protein